MTPEFDRWNSALAGRFLQGERDRPLYLYTDDSVLEEVAEGLALAPEDAVNAFSGAVQETLLGPEPFHRWAVESRKPLASDEAPGYLAVLCFLVFVAVERETVHFQYYPELNRRLGRSGSAAPPGFERDVPALWQRFNAWLKGPGSIHGVPTARAGHFANIGWALSQALVRPSDRRLLATIFHSLGLRAGVVRDGAWLTARVVATLRTMSGSPSRERLLHLNQAYADTFQDLLERELRGWDGAARASAGPRTVLLRLCLDELAGEWWFLAPRIEGTQESPWKVGAAQGHVPTFKGIEAMPDDLWKLVGAGEVGAIEDGPVLVSPRKTHRWLSVDRLAGGWAETMHRDLEVDQLLLVRSDLAGPPVQSGLIRRHDESPPGHSLYAVPAGVDLSDVPMHVPQGPKPELVAGLALNSATHTYLNCATGVPDLVGVTGQAAVNGTLIGTTGGRARLGSLVLGDGEHIIEAQGHKILLRLESRVQEPPCEPQPGTWADDLREVVRLSVPWGGGPVWLIGRDGQLEQRKVEGPSWLAQLGLQAEEIDLTGAVKGACFEPAYVVSSYMRRPWVAPVPDGLAEADPAKTANPPHPALARQLIQDLLSGYAPTSMQNDRSWKRSLAAVLRTASR